MSDRKIKTNCNSYTFSFFHLEFETFIDYGGKLFIKGIIRSTDEKGIDWVFNLQAGRALEDVTHFVIFDSRDDYIDLMGNAKLPFFRKLTG